MKKITLYAIFSLFFAGTGLGQTWFDLNDNGEKIKGYIVGIAGDTIQGYIEYNYPVAMQKRIRFYSSPGDAGRVLYQPEDIRGYGFGERQWASIKVTFETYDGLYTFSRFGQVFMGEGPLKLFRLIEEKDKVKKKINSEEAEKMGQQVEINQKPGSLDRIYIKKQESPAIAVFKRNFKKSFAESMKSFVGDDRDLYEKINQKILKISDMENIVGEYNRKYETRTRK